MLDNAHGWLSDHAESLLGGGSFAAAARFADRAAFLSPGCAATEKLQLLCSELGKTRFERTDASDEADELAIAALIAEAVLDDRILVQLHSASLKRLARSSSLVVAPAGSVIYRRGDRADRLFLVARGSVRLSGAQLRAVGPARVIGQLAMIDSGPRGESAIAITDVVLVQIPAILVSCLVERGKRVCRQGRPNSALSS